MNSRVNLKNLRGEIDAIPSKSVAHRMIIAAMLSGKEFPEIKGSKDITATRECMQAIIDDDGEFKCGESGSTLRFLIPVAGALGRRGVFLTEGRLRERPIKELSDELQRHGMKIDRDDQGNVHVAGKLTSGTYRIRGDISSQYISGLLLALPLLDGDSRIEIVGGIESRSYIDLTLDVLEKSGIEIDDFDIKGNQTYDLKADSVEGDWSNGAFWLCAGALLEGGLKIRGLSTDSIQGDKKVIEILKDFGANIQITDEYITVTKGHLSGVEIDASDIPDLVPILSLVAAVSEGVTNIKNAGRLRLKESDRLESTKTILNGIGGDVSIDGDSLTIRGTGGELICNSYEADGFNDHRIVMTAAVASIVCRGDVLINGSDAVNKSYPEFFEDVVKLGGEAEVF